MPVQVRPALPATHYTPSRIIPCTAAIRMSSARHQCAHGKAGEKVNHRYDWLPYAKFYVPDLKFMDTKQALLFFEVDLSTARPR